jgi:trigger factor
MNETGEETASEETAGEKAPPSMTVQVERLSDVERKLDVEIPWEEVKGRLDEAYKELKQGVTLKGFRKGKVPRKMLEQLFGKHVVKEVAQRLVQDSIAKALTDSELAPVSEPKVEDKGIADGQSFCYSATLQVVPEIEPDNYFGAEVKMRPARVTDEAVELALQAKQREHTAFQSVDGRNTRPGDVLIVDVIGKLGDQPLDFQEQLVDLSDPPREPVPGLAAALTDIAPDTKELELELEVPAEEEGKPVQRARLLVTVHAVREKVIPELDDDFAKDTGEAETLEQLKQALRKKLLEEDEEEARREARNRLLDAIVAQNELPAVPALVDRQLTRSVALQKALLGLGPEEAGLDEEALKERMREDAEGAVKRALLLGAIAKKEQVEVQDADLEKRLAEIASARGQNVARVRSEYEKDGLLGSLRERILEDKTLDLLMSKANIITEEMGEKAEPPPAGPPAESEGEQPSEGASQVEP